MKRALLTALLFVLAWPLVAQTPPSGSAAAPTPGFFSLGKIDFGIQRVDLDTDSSKFREYRDVPSGPYMLWNRATRVSSPKSSR